MDVERANSVPSLKDVYADLFSVREKWMDIGLQLGLDSSDLKQIATNKLNTKDQLREMLDMRINQGGLTWEKIVETLENVKADEIRNKYINPQPSTSSTVTPTTSNTESANMFNPPIPTAMSPSSTVMTAPNVTSERRSTEESNSPIIAALGTMLQSKTAPTMKRSITYPIPVVNDSLNVRGSTEESNYPNAKAKAVGTSCPFKTVPTVIKRSITDPTSVGNDSLTTSTSFSNKPEPLLGERKDSKDHSKMEPPQKKATGSETDSLKPSLTCKRKNPNGTDMPEKKRQKTDQLDQPPHFDESVFVKQPVPIKYCCIQCGKIPTKAFQLQCCDAGKEKGVSCRNCKQACVSCGKNDYKTNSKVFYNIRKLKQYCPNKANGCQETITDLERDKHVESCQYKKMSCKYEELGCKEKLLKEEKETHEKDREIHFDMAMEAILALKRKSAKDATCILALKKQVESLLDKPAVVPVTRVIPVPISLVGEAVTTYSKPLSDKKTVQEFKEQRAKIVTKFNTGVTHTKTDLPGVEVIGQTSLVITSSAQTFQWTGYGFKLHVPEDSLPVDVDSCVLHIYASISGQYQFPGNQELVSAVYWVRCEPPCRFKQQLTAEFQHCAKKAYSNMLTFVRAVCSQKTLPYAFIKVEGCGTFTDQSSYGIIQLDHFSGYAVTGDSPIERMYTASLYYLGRGICSWEIHLVVTWDDEPHVTSIRQHYENERAVRGPFLSIEFEGEKIKLNIPMEGIFIGHWRIRPLILPMLTQTQVDYFKPGRQIPCCQLTAKFLQKGATSDPIPELYHLLSLEGAREPNNVVTIEIDPTRTLRDQARPIVTTAMTLDTLIITRELPKKLSIKNVPTIISRR